jgi:AcrR family transcriptional regulator
LEELAAVGYAELSFETVAARVGVAKTTVYRRHPTKRALVQTAIQTFIDSLAGEIPDTGSLRGDLVALGRQAVRISTSVLGQCLFRLGVECRDPDLVEMSNDFEAKKAARDEIVATRAVARDEISVPAEIRRVIGVLVGTIVFKTVFKRQSVDEVEIGKIVDLLLNGAAKPALPTGRPRR